MNAKHHNNIRNIFNKNTTKLKSLEPIYQEIGSRMIDRFEFIKIHPKVIFDMGSGLGLDTEILQKHFNGAQLVSVDCAVNLLKHNNKKTTFIDKLLGKKYTYNVCGDGLQLPFLNNTCDLLWSNLTLPYMSSLDLFFAELHRVMRPDGCFMISTLGMNSFLELRDLNLSTYNFPDMQSIGDKLMQIGFVNPVIDRDFITLEYDNLPALLDEVKIVGCGANNYQQYITKELYNKLNTMFHTKQSLTLEVYYIHAWQPHSNKTNSNGNIIKFYPRNSDRR